MTVAGVKAFLGGERSPIPYKLKVTDKASELKQVFSGVGTVVHDLRPEQNLSLLRIAMESAGYPRMGDHQLLIEASAKFFQPELDKLVKKMCHGNIAELRSRPSKTLGRMIEKEQEDGLTPASHTDTAAVAIFSKNDGRSFTRHTNYFRPCNNNAVVQMKERAASPDNNSGFPGNMVKILVEVDIGKVKKVPMVCEVLIMVDGCQKEYDRTHKDMNRERDFKRFFTSDNRKGLKDPQVVMAAGMESIRTNRHKKALNEHMTEVAGLSELQQKRTYFMVDGMPVMRATNKKEEVFLIVPDPQTGLFREDHSYASKLKDAKKITREEYILASRAMVPKPNIAASGVHSVLELVKAS